MTPFAFVVSHAKRAVFIVGVRTVKVNMLVSCSRGGQLRVDKVADKTLCKLNNNNNNNNTKKRKGTPQSVAGVILVQKKEGRKKGEKKREEKRSLVA